MRVEPVRGWNLVPLRIPLQDLDEAILRGPDETRTRALNYAVDLLLSGSYNAAEGDQIDVSGIISVDPAGQPAGTFVRAVAEGTGATLQVDADGAEQITNRDRVDVSLAEPHYGGAHLGLVECREHLAGRIDPLVNLAGQRLRHEHRRFLKKRIEQGANAFRTDPSARFVDRAESPGDQQAGAHTLAFENRVSRDRGAVGEKPHLTRVDAGREQFVEGGDYGLRRIGGGRGHLGDKNAAASGLDRDQIGERAAAIDAYQVFAHDRKSAPG